MRHTTFTFESVSLGVLFGQAWHPTEPAKGVLAFIHGLGEHSGCYDHVGCWFAERGYAMYAYDQVGHGRSPGKRGHIPGYEAVMQGIADFLEEVKRQELQVPVFLYGHSLGGQYAMNYLFRERPALQGAIITSPWLALSFEPPAWKLSLARICAKWLPGLTQSNGLAATTENLGLEPAGKDALAHDRISVGLFHSVTESSLWVRREAAQVAVPVPLLLMHGGKDPITSANATKALADTMRGNFLHREWDSVFHELHNQPEAERTAVFEAMLEWLEARRCP